MPKFRDESPAPGSGVTPLPSSPPSRPLHRTRLLQLHGAIDEFVGTANRLIDDADARGEGDELLKAIRGESEKLAELGLQAHNVLWPTK